MTERLLRSLAGLHGVLEATVFFIVPDVSLTLLACRRLSGALRAALWAVAGATIGGLAMWGYGRTMPEQARALLDAIPGIGPSLLSTVRAQLDAEGLAALWMAGFTGVPYKTYAVEWGARGGGLWPLVLWTVPTRAMRFAVSALITSGVSTVLGRWARTRPGLIYVLLGCFWIGLYVVYFAHVGW